MTPQDELPAMATIPRLASIPRIGLSERTLYRLAREDRLAGLIRLPGHRLLVRTAIFMAWLNGDTDATSNIDDGADGTD